MIIAIPSGRLVPAVRSFDTTRFANGALVSGDSTHPDFPARLARTYRLDNLAPGVPVELIGRSRVFDVRLELLDGPDGSVIATADSDAALGAAGTDERLAISPLAEIDYHLRISPASDGGSGIYHLGCLRPAEFIALPELSVPGTINGTLTTTDPLDPIWLPLEFYSDDHRLTFTVEAGREYIIRASSLAEGETGPFTLRTF